MRAQSARIEAVKAHPETPRAHRVAAQALRRLGRVEDARAELQWSLAARFDDTEARAELASLLLDRGDLDGALRLLQDAALLDPGALSPRL